VEAIARPGFGRVGTGVDILTKPVLNSLQSSAPGNMESAHFVTARLDNIPLALASWGSQVPQPDIFHCCRQKSHHLHCQNSIACVGLELEHSDLECQMVHIAQEARSHSDRADRFLGKTLLRGFASLVDLVVKVVSCFFCPRLVMGLSMRV
jgi:hypothetical protein